MTAITFQCPQCGAKLNGRQDRVGTWGTCPKCFKKILLKPLQQRQAQIDALGGLGPSHWSATAAAHNGTHRQPTDDAAACDFPEPLAAPSLVTIGIINGVLRVSGWAWLAFTPLVFVWVMIQQARWDGPYLRTTGGVFDGLFDALLSAALFSLGPLVFGIMLLTLAELIRMILAIEANTRAAGNAVIAAAGEACA